MASITRTLSRIKQDLHQLIPADRVDQICQDLNHRYRKRKLDPLTTIHLFVQQILNGNTALSHLPHLSKMSFDPSAYCDARKRLPLKLLEALTRQIALAFQEQSGAAGRWLGHRTWLMDGSTCSMSDTPLLQKQFGQPSAQKPGCGFPVMHLLGMFDAASGMLMELIHAPYRTHDFSLISQLHPLLKAQDVVVADCGFCSYVHVAMLQSRQVHAVLALHQRLVPPFDSKAGGNQSGAMVAVTNLGEQDQIVTWSKPASKPKWMDQKEFAALPSSLAVRVLRYRVSDKRCRTHEVTLVTTLLDEKKYTKARLAQLFKMRWRVEQNLKDLKITLKMDVLRCKSPEGVGKELAVFAIVYNLVCLVRQRAAIRQRVKASRISFIDVVRWLQVADAHDELPRFIVNPTRAGRHEPRATKRRSKSYDLLSKPRAEFKKYRKSPNKTA